MKQLKLQVLWLHNSVVLLSVIWMQNTQGICLVRGQLLVLWYMHPFVGQQASLDCNTSELVLLISLSSEVEKLMYAQVPK